MSADDRVIYHAEKMKEAIDDGDEAKKRKHFEKLMALYEE